MSKKIKLKNLFMRVLYTQIVNKVDFMVQVKAAEDFIEKFWKKYKIKFSILRFDRFMV